MRIKTGTVTYVLLETRRRQDLEVCALGGRQDVLARAHEAANDRDEAPRLGDGLHRVLKALAELQHAVQVRGRGRDEEHYDENFE
jgi:hypothetical protein